MTRLLRQVLVGLVLVCIISAALLWPARHVLQPLWPPAVSESLYTSPTGPAEQIFHEACTEPDVKGRLAARTRPVSLLAVETIEQAFYAYFSGIRPEPGALVSPDIPEWLEKRLIDPPGDTDHILVLTRENGDNEELPLSNVLRLYRPNELKTVERLDLVWQRLVHRVEAKGIVLESPIGDP